MHEIAPNVYIENAYLGVTLGAINLPHGLLLIDAPPRPEDVRSWRASLLNLGGGVDRLLVNLDPHIDRTLGARAMEVTVVAHDKTGEVFRNRPTAFKSQDPETGADWELCNGLGSIRWAPPEITFSDRMDILWDESPVSLEHHPGPHAGAIWVIAPSRGVAFVGDAVIPGQPPFLANGDLPAWINSLHVLQSPPYVDYTLVGGRTGLMTQADVKAQLELLSVIHERMEKLSAAKAAPEATAAMIPDLMSRLMIPIERGEQFTQRLRWGLYHYFLRHYRAGALDELEA